MRSLLVLTLSAVALSVAAEPATSVSVVRGPLPQRLEIGSVTDVVLDVTHPVGMQAVVEAPPSSRRVQFLDQKSEVSEKDGVLHTRITLRYAFFQPGSVTFPAIPVVADGAGDRVTVSTQPETLEVQSVLAADDVLSPPTPAIPLWVDDYTLLYVVGGMLLAGVGALAFARTRRARPVETPAPPAKLPHEVALEALLALEKSDLLAAGEFMTYYVRLSEAFREYLGARYRFPGTELTTTEIVSRLQDARFPPGVDLTEISAILSSADVVKFGGVVPGTDEARSLLRRAIGVVQLTYRRGALGAALPSAMPAQANEENAIAPSDVAGDAPSVDRWAPPEDRP